jgi:hypothetical protein
MNDQLKDQNPIDPELECPVCMDILFCPVSINCGHSFCRPCLVKILKTKPQCPLCNTPCFLQEKSLKENITLKGIIENKYPEHVKRRKQASAPVEEKKERKIENVPDIDVQFNPLIVLPLHEPLKKVLFPNTNARIILRINFDPKIIYHVCNDRKFVALEDSIMQDGLPAVTYIYEFKDLKPIPNKNHLYHADVKVLQRIMLERVNTLDLDQQVMQGWEGINSQPVTLTVGYGNFLKDKSSNNRDQVQDLVETLEEFLNNKLNQFMNTSPGIMQALLTHINPLVQQGQQDRTMDYFVNFSLGLAKLLRASEDEKKRMFETTNTLERLLLLKALTDKYEDVAESTLIFEIDIPGQHHSTNFKITILIIILIVTMYLFPRLGYGAYYQK